MNGLFDGIAGLFRKGNIQYLARDHFLLHDLAARYSRATENFWKSGGYVPSGSLLVPMDKQAHQNVCDAWGNLGEGIDRHFGKNWFRKLFELFFGDW